MGIRPTTTGLAWVLRQGGYQLLKDEDLNHKVQDALKEIQNRLLDCQLLESEKSKGRNQKKNIKHRARVGAIRERMNGRQEAEQTKPPFPAHVQLIFSLRWC